MSFDAFLSGCLVTAVAQPLTYGVEFAGAKGVQCLPFPSGIRPEKILLCSLVQFDELNVQGW